MVIPTRLERLFSRLDWTARLKGFDSDGEGVKKACANATAFGGVGSGTTAGGEGDGQCLFAGGAWCSCSKMDGDSCRLPEEERCSEKYAIRASSATSAGHVDET